MTRLASHLASGLCRVDQKVENAAAKPASAVPPPPQPGSVVPPPVAKRVILMAFVGLGHPTGDDVLRAFADRMRESVREIDLAGRWGGEEFALLLPGTDLDGGRQLAERIRAQLAAQQLAAPDGEPIPVSASFGVASFPAAANPKELVAAADVALYEAKHSGKNQVVVAQPYAVVYET